MDERVFGIDQEDNNNAEFKAEVTVKCFKSEEVKVIKDGDDVQSLNMTFDSLELARHMFGKNVSPL